MRKDGRLADQLRKVTITRRYTRYAEGSVLVEYGHTKVLCTATFEEGIPRFLKDEGKKQGWLTAEYGMLPRATHDRTDRESARGKQSGRTQEIQRLIGRALRSAIDLTLLGENTLIIDCDVIQADGGTRTASITGGCVAVADAVRYAFEYGLIKQNPLQHMVASVSVGIIDGEPRLDLEYEEDSHAETDMNIVMNEEGALVEVQGTAEGKPFTHEQFTAMLELGKKGIAELIEHQKVALELKA